MDVTQWLEGEVDVAADVAEVTPDPVPDGTHVAGVRHELIVRGTKTAIGASRQAVATPPATRSLLRLVPVRLRDTPCWVMVTGAKRTSSIMIATITTARAVDRTTTAPIVVSTAVPATELAS